jgi:hypothetical protein
MDNEREIAGAARKETAVFLKPDILEKVRKNAYDVYDIQTEYEKKAKNRSWSVILLIGGTLLVTGIVLWIVSGVIEDQTRDVSVDIESFDDINLRNILDLASRVETSYQSALNERAALEGYRAVELGDLETAAEGERYKIRALALPARESAEKIGAINRALEQDIRELNRRYTEQISELDLKIEEYAKQLASFDRDRIEQAQEMQKITDAASLRFQHEKRELISRYEEQLAAYRAMVTEAQEEWLKSQAGSLDEVVARYTAEIAALDPVLQNEAAEAIMDQTGVPDAALPLSRGTPEIFMMPGRPPLFTKINEDYARMDYLTREVLAIPWKNNTPGYIQGMNRLFFRSLREIGAEIDRLAARVEEGKSAFEAQLAAQKGDFEARVAALSGEVDNLTAENEALRGDLQISDHLLSRSRAYFDALSEKNGVAGYVIDPRSESLLVHIDPLYGLSFKDRQALVFRTGNEYIGRILISGEKKVFTASVLELSPGKRIEAGDRILLGPRGDFE